MDVEPASPNDIIMALEAPPAPIEASQTEIEAVETIVEAPPASPTDAMASSERLATIGAAQTLVQAAKILCLKENDDKDMDADAQDVIGELILALLNKDASETVTAGLKELAEGDPSYLGVVEGLSLGAVAMLRELLDADPCAPCDGEAGGELIVPPEEREDPPVAQLEEREDPPIARLEEVQPPLYLEGGMKDYVFKDNPNKGYAWFGRSLIIENGMRLAPWKVRNVSRLRLPDSLSAIHGFCASEETCRATAKVDKDHDKDTYNKGPVDFRDVLILPCGHVYHAACMDRLCMYNSYCEACCKKKQSEIHPQARYKVINNKDDFAYVYCSLLSTHLDFFTGHMQHVSRHFENFDGRQPKVNVRGIKDVKTDSTQSVRAALKSRKSGLLDEEKEAFEFAKEYLDLGGKMGAYWGGTAGLEWMKKSVFVKAKSMTREGPGWIAPLKLPLVLKLKARLDYIERHRKGENVSSALFKGALFGCLQALNFVAFIVEFICLAGTFITSWPFGGIAEWMIRIHKSIHKQPIPKQFGVRLWPAVLRARYEAITKYLTTNMRSFLTDENTMLVFMALICEAEMTEEEAGVHKRFTNFRWETNFFGGLDSIYPPMPWLLADSNIMSGTRDSARLHIMYKVLGMTPDFDSFFTSALNTVVDSETSLPYDPNALVMPRGEGAKNDGLVFLEMMTMRLETLGIKAPDGLPDMVELLQKEATEAASAPGGVGTVIHNRRKEALREFISRKDFRGAVAVYGNEGSKGSDGHTQGVINDLEEMADVQKFTTIVPNDVFFRTEYFHISRSPQSDKVLLANNNRIKPLHRFQINNDADNAANTAAIMRPLEALKKMGAEKIFDLFQNKTKDTLGDEMTEEDEKDVANKYKAVFIDLYKNNNSVTAKLIGSNTSGVLETVDLYKMTGEVPLKTLTKSKIEKYNANPKMYIKISEDKDPLYTMIDALAENEKSLLLLKSICKHIRRFTSLWITEKGDITSPAVINFKAGGGGRSGLLSTLALLAIAAASTLATV